MADRALTSCFKIVTLRNFRALAFRRATGSRHQCRRAQVTWVHVALDHARARRRRREPDVPSSLLLIKTADEAHDGYKGQRHACSNTFDGIFLGLARLVVARAREKPLSR